MITEVEDNKRKGPNTRTVVLAPETTCSRLQELFARISSNYVNTAAQYNMVIMNLYWVMHWTQAIPLEYPLIWQSHA